MAEPRFPKRRNNPRTPPAGRGVRAAGGRSVSGGGASGTRTRTGATARRIGDAGGKASYRASSGEKRKAAFGGSPRTSGTSGKRAVSSRSRRPGAGAGSGAPARSQGAAAPEKARGPRPTGRPSPPAPRSLVEEIRATAKRGQTDRAVRAFEQAVGLLERGREGAAAREALEAKELAPRSGAVREVLGMALYRAGRFQEALRELQAYRRLTGRLDQNHLIADSHRALGAPDKALEAARAALHARVPEEAKAEAAIVGAAALGDMGRFDEGIGLLKTHASHQRDGGAGEEDLRMWYAMGDLLERAGRRTEAAVEFRRVLRHDPAAFDAAERLAGLS